MHAAIAHARLRNQRITRSGPRTAPALVAWLGAVQAQEFAHARWALGLRLPEGAVDAVVARAYDAGQILRTHVMRPTWHFVTPADIRWMLELTGHRIQQSVASYNRRLELDSALLTRASGVIERALGDGRFLSRLELADELARAGMMLDTTRLAHVVMHAELEGIICSGPRRGKQFTYALLAGRAPRAARLPREAALAELAARYFRSHGPATIRDFAWWSGLRTAEAKRGVEMNRATRHVADGLTYWSIGRPPRDDPPRHHVHLLPIYDEYLVAYRDRQAVPHPGRTVAPPSPNAVTFQHALLINGQIAGTWRTTPRAAAPRMEVVLLRPLTRAERRGLIDAVERYERFLNVPLRLSGV